MDLRRLRDLITNLHVTQAPGVVVALTSPHHRLTLTDEIIQVSLQLHVAVP